ncbi:MAG: cadherin-like beta sandwich domain-containing protein [Lachnospiraceae bacterium]
MEFRVDRKYFHKIRTNIICYSLIVAMIGGLFAYMGEMEIFGYSEKTGTVTGIYSNSSLNVRTGPGTTYSILQSDGGYVGLKNGYVVTVKGEEYAADGAKWYKISFIYTNGKTLEGYVRSDYLTVSDDAEYEPDADFEAYMTAQGFPESYKNDLRKLHTKYPNWVFVADKINLDWNEVVENESVIGRSLISKNSISSWKSTDTKAYDWATGTWYSFDGDAWVAASEELVAYALDPRNFLDETYIFQFESLSYQPSYQTEEGLKKLVSGKFLADGTISDDNGGTMTYTQAIMNAAQISGASPFYIASSIIQEIGANGTSGSISGTVKGYEGYYNYYNIGAYTTSSLTAIQRGLAYARGDYVTDASARKEYYLPWNTRYKSIVGGAVYVAKNYISRGQDTLYYKKFDFVDTPYTHQYMTHIIGARQEAVTTSKGYTDEMKSNLKLVFKIPVFNNMPESVCTIPTKDGSPNNVLSSLAVDGISLTPSFNMFTQNYDIIVENNVSSIKVSAAAVDGKAKVSGTGSHSLNVGNNTIKITVTAENGDKREYTLSVVRKAGENGGQEGELKVTVNGLKADNANKTVTGISPESTVQSVKEKYVVQNGTIKVTDKSGNEKTGTVGTGDKVLIYNNSGTLVYEHNIIIYGDVNGDGKITVKDSLAVRKDILGIEKVAGWYAKAADANKANDGITIKDDLMIRKHILNLGSITQ